MALPAGFSPASVRLEGRCLTVGPRQQMKLVSAAGITPAVPWSQAKDVAATPRAGRPARLGRTGDFVSWGELRDPHTLNLCPAARFEIGGPEGSCTLNPPADNGALC